MPAAAGETLLATVYADVNYTFRHSTPSQAQHSRFSKGSYVYLYYSANPRRTKLEIANYAGTPDQDAFFGYFESVRMVSYVQNHPTLCSILLEQSRIHTQAEWHLPTWDDRNEKRWSHKLYNIDLYFWTEKDATTFVNQIKSVLPTEQLNVGAPVGRGSVHSEHNESMSSVVQQLERTAVGAHYPPRAGSTTSAQSLPGPPTPSSNHSGAVQPVVGGYNPAAPAAPEPIAHREKTPPPDDGVTGTGLNAAARYDGVPQQLYSGIPQSQYAHYGQQTQSGLQTTHHNSYFPGPPQAAAPVQPGAQRQASFGPTAASTITSPLANIPQPNNFAPSIASPGVYAHQPPTPSAAPAYVTHATPTQSGSLPPPPPLPSADQAGASKPGFFTRNFVTDKPQDEEAQNRQILEAQQKIGHSTYSYSNTSSPPPASGYNQSGAFLGNMHTQVYTPTEAEAAHSHGHGKVKQKASTPGAEDKYKIGQRVDKVEKGIGKFLKKLDSL